MSFEVALFLTNILEIHRNIFVLFVVVLWVQFRQHLFFVWRLKNLFRQQLYQ